MGSRATTTHGRVRAPVAPTDDGPLSVDDFGGLEIRIMAVQFIDQAGFAGTFRDFMLQVNSMNRFLRGDHEDAEVVQFGLVS